MLGSDVIVTMLEQFGVEVIFGLCGDTSLPFYEALSKTQKIQHVLTRDERSASFMAEAYARFSGKVGVCEGPSGGGALYILPGLAEANGSSLPLVCLTTDIDVVDSDRGTLTELDQRALSAAVTKWNSLPVNATQLPRALRRAFREATTGSLGATHLVLPHSVLLEPLESTDVYGDPLFNGYPAFRLGPDSASVKKAAQLLVEARRPFLVAGAGVLRSGAWQELTELSHLLGAPVATSISGKGSIAENDPYSLGVIGSNGGLPFVRDTLKKSDLVFYIGCRQGSVTTQKWSTPKNGEKKLIQLDVAAERIGHNYRTVLGLVCDAKLGLAAVTNEVADLLGSGEGGKVDPNELKKAREDFLSQIEDFSSDEVPIRPERFFAELFHVLPERTVICADPGTPCPYLSAYWRLPEAGRWFATPRAHGALGYALPAVVGASFARPDAQKVIGIMGDGSFGISVGDLETIVRLKLPVVLIVLNNSSYGWIKAGQKAHSTQYYSVDFLESDHAAIARAYGLSGIRVEDPGHLATALDQALNSEGPILLDVVIQQLQDAKAPVSAWVA